MVFALGNTRGCEAIIIFGNPDSNGVEYKGISIISVKYFQDGTENLETRGKRQEVTNSEGGRLISERLKKPKTFVFFCSFCGSKWLP